jgi:hypothetical protein
MDLAKTFCPQICLMASRWLLPFQASYAERQYPKQENKGGKMRTFVLLGGKCFQKVPSRHFPAQRRVLPPVAGKRECGGHDWPRLTTASSLGTVRRRSLDVGHTILKPRAHQALYPS